MTEIRDYGLIEEKAIPPSIKYIINGGVQNKFVV
jgi:hypothetical protein